MNPSNNPASPGTGKSDFNFEDAMAEIKQIVSDIEGGQLPLDESMKKYERALLLIRQCQELLNRAHQKIEDLTAASQGGAEDPGAAGQPAQTARRTLKTLSSGAD